MKSLRKILVTIVLLVIQSNLLLDSFKNVLSKQMGFTVTRRLQ